MTIAAPYSYRANTDVPAFDDSRPLFVFDGVCVLCSGGASWLMRRKRGERINFVTAQCMLGTALYRHFGQSFDATYLLVADGRAYSESDGYLRLFRTLGGPWHLLRLGAVIPRRLRDAAYRLVARNRYSWFGKTGYCILLSEAQRQRLLLSIEE